MSGPDEIVIDAGGKTYRATGGFAVGVGGRQLHSVQDGSTSLPALQFIEGRVIFDKPIHGDTLRAIKDAVVRCQLPSGWKFTLVEAFVESAEDGARPQQYDLKIVGAREEETKS